MHFNLKPWIVKGNTVEFGDNRPVRAVLLGPTLLHNVLYASIGDPSEDLVRTFGSISLLDGQVAEVGTETPATRYAGMNAVFYSVNQLDNPR